MGDSFVNDNFHAFPTMAAKAHHDNRKKPYVYDTYNMKCYTANPLSKTSAVPAWILNLVIKALNDRSKLP